MCQRVNGPTICLGRQLPLIISIGASALELGMTHITKAQHREGPIRLRPVRVGLAHVAQVRNGGDGISSLIK